MAGIPLALRSVSLYALSLGCDPGPLRIRVFRRGRTDHRWNYVGVKRIPDGTGRPIVRFARPCAATSLRPTLYSTTT